jgi:hypothetical protein
MVKHSKVGAFKQRPDFLYNIYMFITSSHIDFMQLHRILICNNGLRNITVNCLFLNPPHVNSWTLKHFLGTQTLSNIVLYANASVGIQFFLTVHVFCIWFGILYFNFHWIFLSCLYYNDKYLVLFPAFNYLFCVIPRHCYQIWNVIVQCHVLLFLVHIIFVWPNLYECCHFIYSMIVVSSPHHLCHQMYSALKVKFLYLFHNTLS